MPSHRVVAPRGLLSRRDSSPVAGLQVQPDSVSFATQDSDEVVYVVVRRHIITNFSWILTVAFFAVLLPALVIITRIFGMRIFDDLPNGYGIVVPFIYYSYLFTYSLLKINEWYYNLVIVTNKRFIRYAFQPLSSYKVAEAELHHIQEVSQSTIGFFPSIFGYGDILIQTAGSRVMLKIRSIPRPTWLRNVLVDLARLSKNPEP